MALREKKKKERAIWVLYPQSSTQHSHKPPPRMFDVQLPRLFFHSVPLSDFESRELMSVDTSSFFSTQLHSSLHVTKMFLLEFLIRRLDKDSRNGHWMSVHRFSYWKEDIKVNSSSFEVRCSEE